MIHLKRFNESSDFSKIKDSDELSNKLKDYGIPIENWGTGYAKNVDSLLDEILNNECAIIDKGGSIIRYIEFVGVRIFYTDKRGVEYYLIEDKQVFKDNRERRRNMQSSVSEKMKFGEDPMGAAIRGIKEELDISVNESQLIKQRDLGYDSSSNSYPGLKTKYKGHQFTCHLNDTQFKFNGYVEHQKDKSTYFKWIRK